VGTREAYDTICRALEADPGKRIRDSVYDEEVFGNFFIAFEGEGEPRSVVNDRDQLIIYRDLAGTEDGEITLSSLRDADEHKLLAALNL
jgi:hypothetical protein